jgi:chromosome segregation ATPase
VDEDSISQQFDKLEERVEQLVRTCNDLQHAKSGLEAKVQELEQALRTKEATERGYIEEKSVIRSKMDDLLGRLDQILDST